MRLFYLLMAIIGALLPLSQFVPWLMSNGLAIPYMVQLASSNPISAFAWLDVLISGVVLLVFMWTDANRLKMGAPWIPTLGLCLIGVSFALPFYLWIRESNMTSPEKET